MLRNRPRAHGMACGRSGPHVPARRYDALRLAGAARDVKDGREVGVDDTMELPFARGGGEFVEAAASGSSYGNGVIRVPRRVGEDRTLAQVAAGGYRQGSESPDSIASHDCCCQPSPSVSAVGAPPFSLNMPNSSCTTRFRWLYLSGVFFLIAEVALATRFNGRNADGAGRFIDNGSA